MPRATQIDKARGRKMYEEQGESFAEIGRRLGFSAVTVSKWAHEQEWGNLGEGDTDEAFDAPATGSSGVADFVPSDSDEGLRRRIAELEAETARLARENEELKPTRDVSAMLNDRVKWLTENTPEGEAYWLNRAEAEFKKENRNRAKDGLPVFSIKEHPELLDDLINTLKTKEAMARAQEPGEPPARRVKLFIMRNGMPTIEQIPMENQINNMAGSLADGIVRYTRKGFKLTDPFLCPRAGCFRPAASDEFHRWLYDGYCSETHRAQVEGSDQSPTVGLNTKDTILSGV